MRRATGRSRISGCGCREKPERVEKKDRIREMYGMDGYEMGRGNGVERAGGRDC